MSKKVLVTGGAGFIGSHLVDKLVANGHDVVILDNLDGQVHDGKPDHVNDQATFIEGDIRDSDDVQRALQGVERVFHQAAAVGVGQSMYDVSYYTGNNTDGTGTLWEQIIDGDYNIEKVVVASSMSIYGEGAYECGQHGVQYPEPRPVEQLENREWKQYCPKCGEPMESARITERKPLMPTSIYAQTKRHTEEMSLLLGETYGIPTTALRYFNTYGPRQSLGNPYTGVAAIFMSRIKNNNPPVIYEDGNQVRDFIFVEDVARANMLAMQPGNGDYDVFNVGTGNQVSIKQVAETLIAIYGTDLSPQVKHGYRAGDIRDAFADPSKAKEELGFEAQTSFKEGVKRLVSWAEGVDAEDNFDQVEDELAEKDLVK